MFEPKNNETKTFVFVKQSIYIVWRNGDNQFDKHNLNCI